jgi:hypothetical protein
MSKEKSLHSSPQLVFEEQQRVVVDPSHKEIMSLYRKSENSGHSFDTLLEVYRRGYKVSGDEQGAFARVNSFISEGKAYEMDADLIEKKGLWDNIHAKQKRIKNGSGEHMRRTGEKGRPSFADFRNSRSEQASQGGYAGSESTTQIKKNLSGRSTSAEQLTKTEDNDPCWTNYKQVGMKTKNGKQVPNCVPEASNPAKQAATAIAMKKDGKKPHNEAYTGSELTKSNTDDPASRFVGSDQLTKTYADMTPGQGRIKTIKRIVKEVNEDAKGYKNPTGGLTQKGRDHYNNETGGHLKAPVTTPPSKLKKDSKAAGRRRSFCARMGGVEGPMKDEHGKPTRKALALRKWNC